MIDERIKTVADVAAWRLCMGCGACVYACENTSVCMENIQSQGLRPRVDSTKCENCGNCLKICPGIELARMPKPVDQIGNQRFFEAWGSVLGVWEGYAVDTRIRHEGASGGVATALALYAMEKHEMSGTLHIRSDPEVPYLNKTVFSTTLSELLAGAGSRYAPASPCDGLELIEQVPGPSVFIGKPCDVAAVNKAIKLFPKLQEKIGFTVAFFCAGTPSTFGTLEMLKQMGVNDLDAISSLRYRGQGWPGMASVEYRDGETEVQLKQLTYDQSWGDILARHRQWRCHICPDHIGEFADIAVADAWHRSQADNQPGLSVLIARTNRGKEILERAIDDGFIKAEAVPSDILPLCRPGHAAYQGRLWARVRTLKAMKISVPNYHGFDLLQLWASELSVIEKIRSILSTIKRIFVKKIYRRCNMPELFVQNKIKRDLD